MRVRGWELVIWFSISLLIIICVTGAVYLYRLKFSGGLADSSSEWSNFGGYIGGVFGPLISFVALLAVLRTVFLQKKLLSAQQVEFSRMFSLQKATFDSQQQQINAAAQQATQNQINERKDSLMRVIELQLAYWQAELQSATKAYDMLVEWNVGGNPDATPELVRNAQIYSRIVRGTVTNLTTLSMNIGAQVFSDIDTLQRYFIEQHHLIVKDVPRHNDFNLRDQMEAEARQRSTSPLG